MLPDGASENARSTYVFGRRRNSAMWVRECRYDGTAVHRGRASWLRWLKITRGEAFPLPPKQLNELDGDAFG